LASNGPVNQVLASDRDVLNEFVDEALESLRGLPRQLEAYRRLPQDPAPIHAVFRAIHSTKGCAAFLGLDAIKTFSHSLENSLEQIRKGKLSLSEELQRAFVKGFDLLESMLHEVLEGKVAKELGPLQQDLLEEITEVASACGTQRTPAELFWEEIRELADEMSNCGLAPAAGWARRLENSLAAQIVEQPTGGQGPPSKPAGPTPADFVGVRCACGQQDVTDRVAALLQLFLAQQRGQYGDSVGKAFLESAETFAAWASQAGRTTLAEALNAAAGNFRTILDASLDVDRDLLSIIWDRLSPELEQLRVPDARSSSPLHAGDTSDQPPAAPAERSGRRKSRARFVRVKEDRLEEFLQRVSRLFITAELFKDLQARVAETRQIPLLAREMFDLNCDLKTQTAALQQSVIVLLRVPISGVFSKFPRMARSLASELGKTINVHVSGEDTEIEKALAEDLDSPLTHLIRNAIDHGIDPPEQRRARGVSESGNLWLKAERRKNRLRITVQDDGRGIDPDRLRNRALEKGLLTRDQTDALSHQEALHLIFNPGFSTVEKPSQVSGRGVGMDVVRSALAEHLGEVTVESKVGLGTTVCLEIPIREGTLVIDGLMVRQNGQQFIVPFEHVQEIAEVSPSRFCSAHGHRLVTLRGRTYDALSLAEILDLESQHVPEGPTRPSVLVGCKHGSLCLLVDRVVGYRQVVVTTLKDIFPCTKQIDGVAQLGGGRLALVLNVPEVVKNLH